MNNSSDIVSCNVRGAILPLAIEIGTSDVVNAFDRAGVPHPSSLPNFDYSNPEAYSSREVFCSFSRSINWKDEDAARKGLIAFSIIVRQFSYTLRNAFRDDYGYALLDEVDYACADEGLVFSAKGISLAENVIAEKEFELTGLTTVDGIQKQIDAINQAYVSLQDNSEIIAKSKNLVEAVAKAILVSLGEQEKELKNVKLPKLTAKVHIALGLDKAKTEDQKIVQSMGQIIGGLHGLVEGLAQKRNRGSAAHGSVTVIESTNASAQLALNAAKTWCSFVLKLFKETDIPPF